MNHNLRETPFHRYQFAEWVEQEHMLLRAISKVGYLAGVRLLEDQQKVPLRLIA